jgi:hypothetical protein
MSDDYEDDAALDDAPDDDSAERSACEEALRRFFAEGFQPGALLSHAWLQDALGVPEPTMANSVEAFRKWQFTFMTRLVSFQKALLLTHKTALANVFGRGYRIVLPNEQSSWAVNESTREMRRALSKGVSRTTHVNLDALSPAERQAQSADLNRIRSLREVLRKDEAAAKARARRAGMVGDVQ